MASVNFEKFHAAGEVKGIMRHCDLEERKKHEHANADIDRNRADLNTSIKGLNYREVCRAYDERIAELDMGGGSNKRKDRVTCLGLNIPAPADLPAELEDTWFRRVHEVIERRFGAANVIEGMIHRDEVHEYTDAETGETRKSRVHLHEFVIPEKDGRLCAKDLTRRQDMISLNNEIHRMTAEEFGVAFMDGSKRKSRDTVEEMKAKSARRSLQEAQERLERVERREEALKSLTEAVESRERAIKKREDVCTLREKRQQRREEELQRREDALAAQEQALTEREQKAAKLIAAGRAALADRVSAGVEPEGRDGPDLSGLRF